MDTQLQYQRVNYSYGQACFHTLLFVIQHKIEKLHLNSNFQAWKIPLILCKVQLVPSVAPYIQYPNCTGPPEILPTRNLCPNKQTSEHQKIIITICACFLNCESARLQNGPKLLPFHKCMLYYLGHTFINMYFISRSLSPCCKNMGDVVHPSDSTAVLNQSTNKLLMFHTILRLNQMPIHFSCTPIIHRHLFLITPRQLNPFVGRTEKINSYMHHKYPLIYKFSYSSTNKRL